jgi:uncharacterized protein
LFGSYAYGEPTADSDVDLLVVRPFEGHPFRKAAEILNQIRPAFSVDLLVRTAEEIDERLILGDFFLREVVTRGKVLYESVFSQQRLISGPVWEPFLLSETVPTFL